MKIYFNNTFKELLFLLPILSKINNTPILYIPEQQKNKYLRYLSFIKAQNLIKDINFTNIKSKLYFDLFIDVFNIPFKKNIFESLKLLLGIDIELPYKFKTIPKNNKNTNKKTIWISNKKISDFLQKDISNFVYPEIYLDFLNNVSISIDYNQKICMFDEYSIFFDIEKIKFILYYNPLVRDNLYMYYTTYPLIIKS